MKVVRIREPGGPEVLVHDTAECPDLGRDEIRVRVHAVGLNRADLLQRLGRYPAPANTPSDIPGLEYAGVVDQVGSAVALWKKGDRVMGIVGGAAYAEFVVVHERTALRVPEAMTLETAAAIPEAFVTAHDAMCVQSQLRSGETVLVHAVGSGVGLACVQIANALQARVLGTARSASKLERAKQLGLDHALSLPDFAADVRAVTQGRGVDVLIDFMGGSYLEQNIQSLADGGRMMFVGSLGGGSGTLDISSVLRRRLTLRGTVLRSRPIEQRIAATLLFAREMQPLFDRGVLKPVIEKVFSMQDVQAAHEAMAANTNFGKYVLRWDDV